jgi:hypothetical protein
MAKGTAIRHEAARPARGSAGSGSSPWRSGASRAKAAKRREHVEPYVKYSVRRIMSGHSVNTSCVTCLKRSKL